MQRGQHQQCPLCFESFADVEQHFAAEHPDPPNQIHHHKRHRGAFTIQCKFQLTKGGCRDGFQCLYAHQHQHEPPSRSSTGGVDPVNHAVVAYEEAVLCPVCNAAFSIEALEAHVQGHFDSPPVASVARELPEIFRDRERPGLTAVIAKLRLGYATHFGPSKIRLCSSELDWFSSTRADAGWGCGYRNLQNVISFLGRQEVTRGLFGPQPGAPPISSLQRCIQEAWARGFDPRGQRQMRASLAGKWIGTPEYLCVLRSLGIKCEALEFTKADATGKHPQLFAEVFKIFKTRKTVPPMILQHQGHSRTIVGAQENALVVLDPSWSASKFSNGLKSKKTMAMFRITPGRLKQPQYQVIVVDVDNGLMNEWEQENSKILAGKKIT